jgi:osomolarity two-component system sensor histidine kinase TcsA
MAAPGLALRDPALTPTRPPQPASETADPVRLPPPLPPPQSRDTSFSLDFFRYTPVPTIVLDPSLLVVELSDSYCDVSHVLNRDQHLGCHIDAIWQTATLPDLASLRNAIQTARNTSRLHQLEFVHDGKTWSLRTVPISSHGALRCIVMEIQDITEARQRQLELEERMYSNETFRILVETVKDYAIFMLDPRGNVATWSMLTSTTFPSDAN